MAAAEIRERPAAAFLLDRSMKKNVWLWHISQNRALPKRCCDTLAFECLWRHLERP